MSTTLARHTITDDAYQPVMDVPDVNTRQLQAHSGSANASFVNRVFPVSDVEQWQLNALKTIAILGNLSDNWDGSGSPPPAESVRIWACDLIFALYLGTLDAPEFGPESGGALQIDFWSGQARELELHVQPDGVVRYLAIEHDKPPKAGSFLQTDVELRNRLLNWLRQG